MPEKETILAEFNALRAEIIARQTSAQGLLSIQLTAAGALFSLALSGAGRAAVLLVLPLITYMLAGRAVAHSYACQHRHLHPHTVEPAGFGWAWLGRVAPNASLQLQTTSRH